MKLIENVVFENVIDEIGTIESVESNNEKLIISHRNYILLEKFPEKFGNETSLNLYYNKYYHFLMFSILSQKTNGFDAGIEQQEFKILEQGEQFENIDWAIIERISNTIKISNS